MITKRWRANELESGTNLKASPTALRLSKFCVSEDAEDAESVVRVRRRDFRGRVRVVAAVSVLGPLNTFSREF